MKNSTGNLRRLMAAAITCLIVLLGTTVKAQTNSDSPWRLGLGLETGFATGNYHPGEGFVIGGTLRLQHKLAKGLDWTLTSGYYDFVAGFQGKSPVYKEQMGLIPVKLGLKYYVANNWYIMGEAGAGFELSGYQKSRKLILSPGIGWSSKSWDVGARFESISGGTSFNYGVAALRVAYGFGL